MPGTTYIPGWKIHPEHDEGRGGDDRGGRGDHH